MWGLCVARSYLCVSLVSLVGLENSLTLLLSSNGQSRHALETLHLIGERVPSRNNMAILVGISWILLNHIASSDIFLLKQVGIMFQYEVTHVNVNVFLH